MNPGLRAGCLAGMLAMGGLGFGRAACAAEPTPGYLSIQRMFLQEDFEQTSALAQSFLAQNPSAPETSRVWIWLVLSLERLQQFHEALRELEQLKTRLDFSDPVWPEVLFWEGEISRQASQMLRAKLAYQRVIEQHPMTTWALQAHLGIGLIYLQQQAYDLAVGYLHEVALRQPGTTAARDAMLFEGFCHLQLQSYRDAVAILRPLLVQLNEPNTIAQACLYLGESFSGLAQYPEAIAAYERAIASARDEQWRRPAQFGLGWAYYQSGQCESSVRVFEAHLRDVARDDHRSEALFAQGTCLLQMEREPEALVRFEELLSTDPNHSLALESAFVIADAYRRHERFTEAKDLLHSLLKRRLDAASHAQVQLRLASIALEQGNAVQARTVFALAAESRELAIRQAAFNGLGDVQLFFGDLAGAQRLYMKTMQLSEHGPLAAYAAYQLARIHLQLGALNQAAQLFQQLSAQSDVRLADDAKLGLVITYLNQDEEALARSLLETLRRERAGTLLAARTGYYLALLALGQEDEESAKALCREVIEGAPASEEAFESRLLLGDLDARSTSVRAVIERLAETYRSEAFSRNQRARLAKRLGDLERSEGAYEDAVTWYDVAAQLWPSLSGEAFYWIASCYEEDGDVELALQWYRKIEQLPWRTRGRLALARLLERQDRLEEAKAVYEELAKEPIPEAKVAQERLAALQAEQAAMEAASRRAGRSQAASPRPPAGHMTEGAKKER